MSPARRGLQTPAVAHTLTPMLATLAATLPAEGDWAYEPKYDGIRVLAFVDPDDGAALVTRNGNDKARQFPDVADALVALGARLKRPIVLDGEIVASGAEGAGDPARFQALQSRMHLSAADEVARHASARPAIFIAFDLLLVGDRTLIGEPWTQRRDALERLFTTRGALRAAPCGSAIPTAALMQWGADSSSARESEDGRA